MVCITRNMIFSLKMKWAMLVKSPLAHNFDWALSILFDVDDSGLTAIIITNKKQRIKHSLH